MQPDGQTYFAKRAPDADQKRLERALSRERRQMQKRLEEMLESAKREPIDRVEMPT